MTRTSRRASHRRVITRPEEIRAKLEAGRTAIAERLHLLADEIEELLLGELPLRRTSAPAAAARRRRRTSATARAAVGEGLAERRHERRLARRPRAARRRLRSGRPGEARALRDRPAVRTGVDVPRE